VVHDEVLPQFFFRCLQTTRFREVVENRCEGSKIRHLYFCHFEDFAMLKLTRKEQEEIVDVLDAADTRLSIARVLKGRLVELRQALTNSILS
jgi:hypothetical protein